MGVHAWLLMASTTLETLIVLKFSQGEFPEPAPKIVKFAWSLVAVLLVAFPIFNFAIPQWRRRKERLSKKRVAIGQRKQQ